MQLVLHLPVGSIFKAAFHAYAGPQQGLACTLLMVATIGCRALLAPCLSCNSLLSQVAIAALAAFLSYLWPKFTLLFRHHLVFSPFSSSPGTAAAAP